MRTLAVVVCAAWVSIAAIQAQTPVTVTLAAQPRGAAIPDDFIGLSFGMRALLPDGGGGRFFSATNKPLVTLFENLGVRHLRVGGTTVESPPQTAIPDHADIDSFFAFVKAAHVAKVIYSLRLLETNSALRYDVTNAAIAKYIWRNHRRQLDCFALGNEPDLNRVFKQDVEITNFSTYLAKWRRFAAAVSDTVPAAKFAGPDAGSGNVTWTTNFAAKLRNSGNLAVVTEHFYVGGKGKDVPAEKGIEDMLSPGWVAVNQKLYDEMAAPVLARGLAFRFTEANDHYSGGVHDASDTFAGALWALDFLHWWAAHDARGVDFHNTQWVVNDIIKPDADHELMPTPKGYGLRAFDLGAHGSVESLALDNPAGLNLTAYAVRGATGDFVTLINKEYGTNAADAKVTIVPAGKAGRAAVIFLSAPKGDVTMKTGMTLGGAAISGAEPWRGEWKPATLDESGHCTVTLPAASAAVVRISSK